MGVTESEKDFFKKVGKRIVSLREEIGIKQIELATNINIEDSALRRIESGRTNPTLKTLLRISEHLGVTFTELFNFSEDKIE